MKSTDKLPQILKDLRNEHHYSQEELAEKLNVSRQAVSRWENGKAFPDISNLLFLSELYDVPLDYMLGEEEKRSEEDLKDGHSLIEMLVLSVILVISSRLSLVGILVAISILIWSFYSKKDYKLMYVLIILCITINIYELYTYYMHMNSFGGNLFIIPR